MSPKKKVKAPSAGIRKKTGSKQTKPAETTEEIQPAPIEFPIVGIGASAGGLEAFGDLLKELPPNTGMAYVYIQHLDPKHESMLPEIIGRETRMPVLTARNGMTVEPNKVYIIPPGYYLGIYEGKLNLTSSKEKALPRMPVDYFFRSLAKEADGRSIGVVLSGTASDGTIGLMAIKAVGGITFAQDATAKYDGMPNSAVSAGCVDFTMPPGKIARELARISQHPSVATGRLKLSEEALVSQESLERIFSFLRSSSGVDFSFYKPTTVRRRIKRRMLLNKVEQTADYVKFLREHPGEIDNLYQDILINVTSFFRDPEAFDFLKEKVFPDVTEKRKPEDPVRIWVPGCSTGEEAYSIAMSLMEYLGDRASVTPIQIFATDIDEAALEKARAGKYPESISADVSPERLRRFFLKQEKVYQISKQLRDMCIFAKHNIIKDPPFSRLDLISCRNLLIYLGPILQKKIFPIFHYALSPKGYLMLGSSETIGRYADLFTALDKKQKIYLKKALPERQAMHFAAEFEKAGVRPAESSGKKEQGRADLVSEADKLILNKYSLPSVLVNKNMDIIRFSGKTGRYLEHASGEASLNLFRMAKEGLPLELRKAMAAVSADNIPARREGIIVKDGSIARTVDMEITPIRDAATGERNFLIVFDEAAVQETGQEKEEKPSKKTKTAAGRGKGMEAGKETNKELNSLRKELASTKDYLQSIIEEQETTNEELRSANEEIQASNEELQSTNEELETAKEELQSANEELATVNDELENRNQDLSRLNDDLNNLLASVSLPMVILERDLRIRRFTPVSRKVMNLIPTDIGRPVSDIKPSIEIKDLESLVAGVIDSVTVVTQEVRDAEGRWYSLQVHPYLTIDKKVDGAVLMFIDIDAFKKGVEEAEAARDYAGAFEFAVDHPALVLDSELKVVSSVDAFYRTFETGEKDVVGNQFNNILGGSFNVPGLKEKLERTAATGEPLESFRMEVALRTKSRAFIVHAKQISIKRREQKFILLELKEP